MERKVNMRLWRHKYDARKSNLLRISSSSDIHPITAFLHQSFRTYKNGEVPVNCILVSSVVHSTGNTLMVIQTETILNLRGFTDFLYALQGIYSRRQKVCRDSASNLSRPESHFLCDPRLPHLASK